MIKWLKKHHVIHDWSEWIYSFSYDEPVIPVKNNWWTRYCKKCGKNQVKCKPEVRNDN